MSEVTQAEPSGGKEPSAFNINPLVGTFGAEVSNVDLARLADTDASRLLATFYEHSLICIRDQSHLSPAQFAEFASRFGELDTYPFMTPLPGHPHVIPIIKEPTAKLNFGGGWHTDTSYNERPPAITMLHAIELPTRGGDTLFSNTALAFDAWSDGMRELVKPLQGVYSASIVHGSGGAYAQAMDKQADAYQRQNERAEERNEHPLIRTHPVTARQAIYCSLAHTVRIQNMTRKDSLPLLQLLQNQATQPEFQTRVKWEPGTITVWDNRCVWHYALNDYHGERRHMHRITVKGERPT